MGQGLAAEADWFEPRALLPPLRWVPFPLAGIAVLLAANPLAVTWWGRWASALGIVVLVLCAAGTRRGLSGAVLRLALFGAGFYAAALATWVFKLPAFPCSPGFTCVWLPDTWLGIELWAILGALIAISLHAAGTSRRLLFVGIVLMLAGFSAGEALASHPPDMHTLAEWSWDGTAPGESSKTVTGPSFMLGKGSWEVGYQYDCSGAASGRGQVRAEVLDLLRRSTQSWAPPVSGTFTGTGSGHKAYGAGPGTWQVAGATGCRVTFTVRQ